MTDEQFMEVALDLAKKGCGFVNPNPMVGAVIAKQGRIIGSGFHERYGGLHAERNALADCRESPKGATLYVTLEPCCHHGKTPPCTDAVIESGVSKVVIGSMDPNPAVSGKGAAILRSRGIQVIQGILREPCDQLNQPFFHYIKTKTPYVVMKYAMTMDGKIAAYTGKSRWITGEAARHNVHRDRLRYFAVMTGVGTVLEDDPLLTCRLENGRNPIRIVCDTRLRTPLSSRIVQTADAVPTILATACLDPERRKPYENCGCRILETERNGDNLDLRRLMTLLGEEGVDSILLEGGAALNWSALKSGIVHRVQAYIAPKLLGGEQAKSPIGGQGAEDPAACCRLKNSRIRQLGQDWLIESEVEDICSQEL